MAPAVPRLRVFGGPNGSGKSTIKEALKPEWLGVYVNADDLEKDIRRSGHADLAEFGLCGADLVGIHPFLSNSTLLARETELLTEMARLTVEDTRVDFGTVKVNSYHASVLCDFIRHRLMALGISFTFETVMSSPDKVDFMAQARTHGFRTYLYFVATDDPEINVELVNNRVRSGGHPVPPEKIRERYYRSLHLLPQAIDQSSRAYVFDNSGPIACCWPRSATTASPCGWKRRPFDPGSSRSCSATSDRRPVGRQRRTGIPRAAINCLASPTVCSP